MESNSYGNSQLEKGFRKLVIKTRRVQETPKSFKLGGGGILNYSRNVNEMF